MIPASELKPVLQAMINMAAPNPETVNLDVLMFEFPDAKSMSVTATNWWGLMHAVFDVAHVVKPGDSFGVNVFDAEKILSMPDECVVSLIIYDTTLLFMSGEISHPMQRQCRAGDFPNYKPVLVQPRPAPLRKDINASALVKMIGPITELLDGFNQVSITIGDNDHPMFLKFKLTDHLECLRSITGLIMPIC